MDRMRFIPGKEAKDEIFDAKGRIFFSRECAISYADEYVMKAPNLGGSQLSILYQTMLACMSEGEQVDILFGLRSPDPAQGQEVYPSGEDVGHTWAILKTPDGKEKHLWEVGRRTPALGDAYAARAFNAYRTAMAGFLGEQPPEPFPIDPSTVTVPGPFNDKPVISRALSPSNLYYASSRMWYFIDLSPPGDINEPAMLTRPMRAFDALILAACLTLANGTPPLVFAVRNSLEGLGKMPADFTRAYFEADETLDEPPAEKPLLIM
ncbi:hypothetical protein PT974_01081 [Cladobotryum mycophilum]|uniref:Uncharacterized protein n=1 Tax=Cladobotryum mycophilum TaxID=491253 RepID=A0ABR0T2Q6_9HYPO